MVRNTNKYWLTLFIITALFLSACVNYKAVKGDGKRESKTYSLHDFSALKINGTYNVTLVQGNTNEVRVEGDNNIIPVINVNLKNDELNISSAQPYLSDSGVNIIITFKELKNISISGAMLLKSQQKLAFDNLSFKDDGASIINLDMNCVSLTIESKGSSTYDLTGATVDFSVGVSSASILNCKNFPADKATINADGSAVCTVNVLTSMEVTAKGTSEVNYYGTPEVAIKKGNTAYVNKVFYE